MKRGNSLKARTVKSGYRFRVSRDRCRTLSTTINDYIGTLIVDHAFSFRIPEFLGDRNLGWEERPWWKERRIAGSRESFERCSSEGMFFKGSSYKKKLYIFTFFSKLYALLYKNYIKIRAWNFIFCLMITIFGFLIYQFVIILFGVLIVWDVLFILKLFVFCRIRWIEW